MDKPVAGIMVALVPDDPEMHIELFRRDQSDFDGTFLVRGRDSRFLHYRCGGRRLGL